PEGSRRDPHPLVAARLRRSLVGGSRGAPRLHGRQPRREDHLVPRRRPVRLPDLRPRPPARARLPSLAPARRAGGPGAAAGRHPRAELRRRRQPRLLPVLAGLPDPARSVAPPLRRRRRALPEPEHLRRAAGAPPRLRAPHLPLALAGARGGRAGHALPDLHPPLGDHADPRPVGPPRRLPRAVPAAARRAAPHGGGHRARLRRHHPSRCRALPRAGRLRPRARVAAGGGPLAARRFHRGRRLSNLPSTLPGNVGLLRSAYGDLMLAVAIWGVLVALVQRRALFVVAVPYVLVGLFFFSCWSRPDGRYLSGVFCMLPMLIVE